MLQSTHLAREVQAMPVDEAIWMSTREAARAVGVDPATWRRWDDAGRLAGIRRYQPGKYRFYRRADVEDYIRRAMGNEGDEGK